MLSGLVTITDWLLPGITAPTSGKETCKPLATSSRQPSLQFRWNSLLSKFWPIKVLKWKYTFLLEECLRARYSIFACGRVKVDGQILDSSLKANRQHLSSQQSELHKSMLHPKQCMVKNQNLISFTSGGLLSLAFHVSLPELSVSIEHAFVLSCEVVLEGIGMKEPWILPTAQSEHHVLLWLLTAVAPEHLSSQ